MNLCIIPARGGSKRIPKKNIKNFCGKPLISYSIEVAQNSNLFDKIVVSTDSDEIAEVVSIYNVDVQIRPAKLSGDYIGLDKTIDYVLKCNPNYEYMCLLFATAPLLQKEYLIQGYNKLKENKEFINSISVVEIESPFRSFEIVNNTMKMFFPENYFKRSQDLPKAYKDAGAFSWRALNRKSFNSVTFSNESIPVILPRYMGIDIDTIEDFKMAEIMYNVAKQMSLIK